MISNRHIMPSSLTPPSHSSISIQLDSPDLVLRALSGNESSGQPASLSGVVELQLSESTHLKDVNLNLRSMAKIDYVEPLSGKRFHHHHPIYLHEFSFLPTVVQPSSQITLQAGIHRFPFLVSLPADLPASLRTYTGSGLIYYKLKATATRAGFLPSYNKWESKQLLRVARSFPAEAVEWNQTLEIENTWPGKVSYEISLPHKAFAAGDSIPVSLKFSPLMKGVRVTSLITTIKEHVTLVGKTGTPPHVENRDVAQCKYEFGDNPPTTGGGSEPLSRADPVPGPSNGRRHLSSSDLTLLTSRLNEVSLQPRRPSFSNRPSFSGLSALPSPSRSIFENAQQHTLNSVGNLAEPDTNLLSEIEDDVALSQDIDTVIELVIPSWTTPSHTLPPITVSHKLKFSAFIINPDGHTSELRCALPLHILASHLSQEANVASASARNLHFNPSGTLTSDSSTSHPSDLPSYPEHVRDRLASIDSNAFLTSQSIIPAPWAIHTPHSHTPLSTPPLSRPSSPGGGYFPDTNGPSNPNLNPSPAWTPSHDAELIRSLNASPTGSTPGPASVPPTIMTPSSNNPSRASSPGLSDHRPSSSVSSTGSSHHGGNVGSSGSGFFHIHLPKLPLHRKRNSAPKALTAMRSSSSVINNLPTTSGSTSTSHAESDHEIMSRVPSYTVASRGALGGGPVPLSSLVGLPSYEESSGGSQHGTTSE